MHSLVIIPLMHVGDHSRFDQAFEAAQSGIRRAQSRLDRAAEDVARFGLEADRAAKEPRPEPSYLVDDMVELSRARVETRVNRASFQVADEVSRELVSVGRKVDMRA